MVAPTGRPLDVLDVLIQEHREVEYLLNRLRLSGPEPRRDVADRMIAHLVRHTVAEELLLHPFIQDYLLDGEGLVANELAEHEQLEGMLRELEGLDPGDVRFLDVVLDLQTSLAQHIADEEGQLFAQLRFAVPADRLVRLRTMLERSERLSSTAAGPDSPAGEVLCSEVGTGVGMVDRVRDALGARRSP